MGSLNTKLTFIVDRVQKGYRGLHYSYRKGFEKQGVQCSMVPLSSNEALTRGVRFVGVFNEVYRSFQQKRVLRAIAKDDSSIVFVMKGYHLQPSTIDSIKKMGRKVICFNPDDPFSSVKGSSNELIKGSVSKYDDYFIWSKRIIPQLSEAGCKNVHYLPFAADTDLYTNKYANNEKLYSLGFLGNASPERIEFIEKIDQKLNNWTENKVLVGHDWDGISSFEKRGHVLGKHFSRVIGETKVNLNLLRNQNKGSHNMRTFDIPASGGFMLHEYSDEVASFFEEGLEAEFFRSVDECAEKIRYYAEHDAERNKIAEAGYRKVIEAGYTYDELARNIIKIVLRVDS